MRKADKKKLLIVMGISLIMFMAGCVDTSVQPIPSSITYYSQLNFVNLATVQGAATLTFDGQSLGSVAVGSSAPSAFMQVVAGGKTLSANFANGGTQTFNFTADTDYKIRIFLVGDSTSASVVKSAERYIWQTPGSEEGKKLFPSDTGWVAFFDGSPDAVLNQVQVTGGSVDTTIDLSALSMGQGMPYMKFKAGTYQFDVTYNDSLSTTFSQALSSKGKYTAVIYDYAANLKSKVFTDD